jgi:hypothetical protein
LSLKVDREGQRRTFYSLRHTYICLRLMEGADVYQIAKNCRTSVKMIEEFYASHIKNMVPPPSMSGVPSSRKRERARRDAGRTATKILEIRWFLAATDSVAIQVSGTRAWRNW